MTIYENIQKMSIDEMVLFLDKFYNNDEGFCTQNYLFNCTNCIGRLDGIRCQDKIRKYLNKNID